MGLNKKKSSYNLRVLWNLIKHGLFLQGIRHAFAKIGINIMPYYWVQEEISLSLKPVIKDDMQNYEFVIINQDDIKYILKKIDPINESKILKSLKDGQECVGLKHNGDIAAYMFIELNDFKVMNRLFRLQKNEAYLLNMFTFDQYRGKNLAPYLRYSCYRYLEQQNIMVKYSISNYFNKSAIRFKEKLNSKHLKLYVNIELFKILKWDFLLKSYQ